MESQIEKMCLSNRAGACAPLHCVGSNLTHGKIEAQRMDNSISSDGVSDDP